MSDEIVAIDPASGEVVSTWDAGGLLSPEEAARADVLNGIAHDPARDVFYLTGKLWPRLFEVALD
jgi:glutamine cyclotransferase